MLSLVLFVYLFMLKSTGCFLKFDLFRHTIFTGTYCLVWSFRPKRRGCKLERGQSHLGGAPNTCCRVVLETQCWADSDYLLLLWHRCNMLVFRALPFEIFNIFFNSQHSCKLSSGMCCCHICTFSVYLIHHPSFHPSFHPKKLTMKCFFRQNSRFMLQTWSRRQWRDALPCSALHFYLPENPLFGTWNMVRVSVHSSQNTNKRAWRWWCF